MVVAAPISPPKDLADNTSPRTCRDIMGASDAASSESIVCVAGDVAAMGAISISESTLVNLKSCWGIGFEF